MSNDTRPVIYLPGDSNLSNDELALDAKIGAARTDLGIQLGSHGMFVKKIHGEEADLRTMLQRAERSDAFVFPPMTSLPDTHPEFKKEAAQRWFEFFSLVTGVHVGSREKYGKDGFSKPCVVMDPDGQWSMAVKLLEDLKLKGMFRSEVSEIVQMVPNAASMKDDYNKLNLAAVITLKEALHSKKRMKQEGVHALYPPTHMFEPSRKDIKRHQFGVAMFGSATTRDPSYTTLSEKMSFEIGRRGWRMVTGAGTDGCMGAFDRGFERGKKDFNGRFPNAPYKPSHVGVSTQSILRLEGPPLHLDQLIITDNIYDRMQVMIFGQKEIETFGDRKLGPSREDENLKKILRTRDAVKVICVAPGGTGTLHEFATLMHLDAKKLLKERKVLLLNFPSHLDKKKGFWDPLIATAEKLGFKDSFEVVNSPEAAIKRSDELYKEWLARDLDQPNLPHPLFNPVNKMPAASAPETGPGR
jgi:predicted Rossmann-fold nucleotide-binding protein